MDTICKEGQQYVLKGGADLNRVNPLKRRGVVRLPDVAISKVEVDLRGVEVRVA